MKRFVIVSVLAIALALSLDSSSVRAAEPDCADSIGTFLTKNAAEESSYTSRSLISFTDARLAFFTDSGEGGEAGFAPFTDGRGAWRCVADETGAGRVWATTLDFTLAAQESKAQIGRLDFDLGYDADKRTIAGTATLYLLPFETDPLAPGELKDGRRFEITGRRVEAP